MTLTTYLGSGDASRRRRDYRPEWLDNLADDMTIEGSALTGIAEGPESIRAILGFARTLYDNQEFNYVGRYGDDGFPTSSIKRRGTGRSAPIPNLIHYNKLDPRRPLPTVPDRAESETEPFVG